MANAPLDSKLPNRVAFKLFPTMLWAHEVEKELAARFNAAFHGVIDKAKASAPELEKAERWQTQQNLHLLPEMSEFQDLVLETAQTIVASQAITTGEMVMSACWANVGGPNTDHRPHNHPNNYLSGVYYVHAPEGANVITFVDPRPQAGVMVPPCERMSELTSQTWSINVASGALILFPAWLMHFVPPNGTNENRISIAFNLMFKNYTEQMSGPRWEGHVSITDADS